jgi:hypothetical protein
MLVSLNDSIICVAAEKLWSRSACRLNRHWQTLHTIFKWVMPPLYTEGPPRLLKHGAEFLPQQNRHQSRVDREHSL